jgi:hypothetical protein
MWAKKAGEKEEWTFVSDQLSEHKPSVEGINPDDIMSYKEYLDRNFPSGTPEQDLARNTKLLNFARPGNPGAKFKGPYEKMLKALSLPKAVKDELGINDDAVGDSYILQNLPVIETTEEGEDSGKKGAASSEEDD